MKSKHEAAGVITDEGELQSFLDRGYWLTNYQPGELALFYPPDIGGLYKYVVGDLAERYGEIYDAHNFRVHKRRQTPTGGK